MESGEERTPRMVSIYSVEVLPNRMLAWRWLHAVDGNIRSYPHLLDALLEAALHAYHRYGLEGKLTLVLYKHRVERRHKRESIGYAKITSYPRLQRIEVNSLRLTEAYQHITDEYKFEKGTLWKIPPAIPQNERNFNPLTAEVQRGRSTYAQKPKPKYRGNTGEQYSPTPILRYMPQPGGVRYGIPPTY